MASSNSNTGGVLIRGVETSTVASVIDLVDNIEAGSFSYLDDPAALLDLPPGTIIGIGPGGQPYTKGPSLQKVDNLDPEVAAVLLPAGTAHKNLRHSGDYLIVGAYPPGQRPDMKYGAKLSTYECGVDPVGSGWSQTYVRYYVFGLLFVVFDVEAVFLFPWAIQVESLGMFGVVAMIIFMLTLVEGLVYAVKKGVLKWD